MTTMKFINNAGILSSVGRFVFRGRISSLVMAVSLAAACALPGCNESSKEKEEDASVPVNILCGNGTLDDGEQCDLGEQNSNEPNAECRTDCTLRRCGDGVVDEGVIP